MDSSKRLLRPGDVAGRPQYSAQASTTVYYTPEVGSKPRRGLDLLVLCCDGTSIDSDRPEEQWTNVYRLESLILKTDETTGGGVETLYMPGVGTGV